MSRGSRVQASRVIDEAGRRQVVEVLRATYQREKRWVTDPELQAPPSDLERDEIAWFIADIRGRPAGVLRVHYAPPLAQYAAYGFKLIDPSVNVDDFIRRHRVAEIERFAVLPRYRRQFLLAAALMRAATAETVARGFTHFVTDVFEDDPHSPYGFHTRVIGFHPVATHDIGELQSRSRRITLVLDLRAAYKRLKASGNWVFRYLIGEWPDALHRRLAV
jgi:ribosomal protein S18 acetylase RimI-like enzyme